MKKARSLLMTIVALVFIATSLLGCNFPVYFQPTNSSFDEATLMMVASRSILDLYIPADESMTSSTQGGVVLASMLNLTQAGSKQQLNEQLALSEEFLRMARSAREKGNDTAALIFEAKADEHKYMADQLEKKRADWRRNRRFFYQVNRGVRAIGRGLRSFGHAIGNIIEFGVQAVFANIQNQIAFYVNEIRAFLANPIRYAFDLSLTRQLEIIKNQFTSRLGPFFGQRVYELLNVEGQAWHIERHLFTRKTQPSRPSAQGQKVTEAVTEAVPEAETTAQPVTVGETTIIGNWHGAACDEAEGTFQYRWSVDLIQDPDTDQFVGTIKFHACPGGGRVLYRVLGEPTTDSVVTLTGIKKEGGGDLYANSPATTTFTVNLNNGSVSPNLAQ
jgi:hypothetical protein